MRGKKGTLHYSYLIISRPASASVNFSLHRPSLGTLRCSRATMHDRLFGTPPAAPPAKGTGAGAKGAAAGIRREPSPACHRPPSQSSTSASSSVGTLPTSSSAPMLRPATRPAMAPPTCSSEPWPAVDPVIARSKAPAFSCGSSCTTITALTRPSGGSYHATTPPLAQPRAACRARFEAARRGRWRARPPGCRYSLLRTRLNNIEYFPPRHRRCRYRKHMNPL